MLKQVRHMNARGLAVGIIVISVACGCGKSDERLTRFDGSQLDLTATLQCTSDEFASGGFWRSASSGIEQGIRFGHQNATTWRITVRGNLAEVSRFSGATQTLEEPQHFAIEETFGGLLLIYERSAFESAQLITIDLTSSSFVYSTQHVSPLYNRANIFYGTCHPYE
jgi:hypothetical protein